MTIASPFAVTTFCDDIRYELQNKISLSGVYGGDLISAVPPPFILPRFGVFLQVRLPLKKTPAIDLSMYMPEAAEPFYTRRLYEAEEAFEIDKEFEEELKKIPDSIPARLFNVPLLFTSLTVPATGTLRVRIMCGSERVRADSLRISYRAPES